MEFLFRFHFMHFMIIINEISLRENEFKDIIILLRFS